MTGGTEFSEIQESIKETPEVAEVKQTLDRAAFEPAAAIEKGDIQQSEDLQKAFEDTVQLAPAPEMPPVEAESPTPERSPASEGVAPNAPSSEVTTDTGESSGGGDNPIGGVGGVTGPGSIPEDFNFNTEMDGSQPGEVRDFANPENESAYELRADGITTSNEFTERISETESLIADSGESPGAESESGEPVEAGARSSANTLESVKISASEEFPTAISGDSSQVNPKVTGQVPSVGVGLPDDDDEISDVSSESEQPDTSFPSAEIDRTLEGSVQDAAQDQILSVEELTQRAVREAYLETGQDLAFYAQKVKFFNTQKESVRTYLSDIRDQVGDQSAAAETTIDFIGVALGEVAPGAEVSEREYAESIDEGDDLPKKPARDDYPDTDEGNAAYNAAVEEYNASVAVAQTDEVAQDSPDAVGTDRSTAALPVGSILVGGMESTAFEILERGEPTPVDLSPGTSDTSPVEDTSPETDPEEQETPEEINEYQEGLDELLMEKKEILKLIQRMDSEISLITTAIKNNTFVHSNSEFGTTAGAGTGLTYYLLVEEQPDGSFILVAAGGAMTLEEQAKIPEIMTAEKNKLYSALAKIEQEIANLKAQME